MKKILLFCLLSAVCTKNLWADEYTELVSYRDSLKQQIQAVDSEIARCEKSLKNWQTATIIGGVGAVASGISIIMQNNQVQENKKNIK